MLQVSFVYLIWIKVATVSAEKYDFTTEHALAETYYSIYTTKVDSCNCTDFIWKSKC